MKLLCIAGTRPEAIKLSPIITEAKKRGVMAYVLSTGQHGDVAKETFASFGHEVHFNVNTLNYGGYSINKLIARILYDIEAGKYHLNKPDICFVQGDTASTLAGALWAFNHQIRVAHVEAGLRSGDRVSPFPEEMNRRMVSQLANYHFCPTQGAKDNLLKEGIEYLDCFVVGNTVVDAIHSIVDSMPTYQFKNHTIRDIAIKNSDKILFTMHRRENIPYLEDILIMFSKLTMQYPESFDVVFPVHPNPEIVEIVRRVHGNFSGFGERVHYVEPLNYTDMINFMHKCRFVVTDSGGIQEEAPYLGKPVIVARKETERVEGVDHRVAVMGGVNPETIKDYTKKLLFDYDFYMNMVDYDFDLYGRGKAAEKIINHLGVKNNA